MNKKRRNELKRLKLISRVKRFEVYHPYYLDLYGERLSVFDLIENEGFYRYRNSSTICSCSICSYPKYDRAKQKIINFKLLNEQLSQIKQQG